MKKQWNRLEIAYFFLQWISLTRKSENRFWSHFVKTFGLGEKSSETPKRSSSGRCSADPFKTCFRQNFDHGNPWSDSYLSTGREKCTSTSRFWSYFDCNLNAFLLLLFQIRTFDELQTKKNFLSKFILQLLSLNPSNSH